jgi:hypothetical protein
MDAASITGIRTAAVSAVATRLLAKDDAGDLAILGSGVQAKSHLEAMRAVRTIKRVRVWSRNEANARSFAEWAGHRFGTTAEILPTAREAVAGADIVCTTTSSKVPILAGEWLSPGAHINVVGSSLPAAREVDAEAVKRSRLFTDRMESALNEAGDFLLARKEGLVDDSHILGEIGELLIGTKAGRTSGSDITMFGSLGLGLRCRASPRSDRSRTPERRHGGRAEASRSKARVMPLAVQNLASVVLLAAPLAPGPDPRTTELTLVCPGAPTQPRNQSPSPDRAEYPARPRRRTRPPGVARCIGRMSTSPRPALRYFPRPRRAGARGHKRLSFRAWRPSDVEAFSRGTMIVWRDEFPVRR